MPSRLLHAIPLLAGISMMLLVHATPPGDGLLDEVASLANKRPRLELDLNKPPPAEESQLANPRRRPRLQVTKEMVEGFKTRPEDLPMFGIYPMPTPDLQAHLLNQLRKARGRGPSYTRTELTKASHEMQIRLVKCPRDASRAGLPLQRTPHFPMGQESIKELAERYDDRAPRRLSLKRHRLAIDSRGGSSSNQGASRGQPSHASQEATDRFQSPSEVIERQTRQRLQMAMEKRIDPPPSDREVVDAEQMLRAQAAMRFKIRGPGAMTAGTSRPGFSNVPNIRTLALRWNALARSESGYHRRPAVKTEEGLDRPEGSGSGHSQESGSGQASGE